MIPDPSKMAVANETFSLFHFFTFSPIYASHFTDTGVIRIIRFRSSSMT